MGRSAAAILTLGLSEAFRQPDKAPSSPAPLPKAPTPEGAAEKANETIKKKKAAISLSSKSIYSSPLGISGEASVARKTLLGQ